MQLTESPPAGWRELTIRSRSYGGRLTVFRMMIISFSDYLTSAGRTTSVTRYPIRFVIEALFFKILKNNSQQLIQKKWLFSRPMFVIIKIMALKII